MLTLRDWENRVGSVFTTVIMLNCTSSQADAWLSELRTELRARSPKGRARYTAYEQGYVQGLIDAERRNIAQNLVEFCYEYRGELYSTHMSTKKRHVETLHDLQVNFDELRRGHFWKGSSKPWHELL